MNLKDLGFNDHFEKAFEEYRQEGYQPARVIRQDLNRWTVATDQSSLTAELAGRYKHETVDRSEWPTVGDWVVIKLSEENSSATIMNLLPRLSSFNRKATASGGMPDSGGRTDQQVLAANLDVVFLVSALDHDFNIRRLERYLLTAYDSGARPVILLNKTDLCDDIEARVAEVKEIATGVDILKLSGLERTNIDLLREYLQPGLTGCMLGSSGVGKSTLINCLLGSEQLKTGAVREDDSRGRHTTSHRELVLLPGGGMLIDTPGIRELQLWVDQEALDITFDEISQLAESCRFRDCKHQAEPGCAVVAAAKSGELDPERLTSYHKLGREMKRLEARQSGKARHIENLEGKRFASMVKEAIKHRTRRR